MPWKECHVMDERVRFVARLLDGEKMAVLCEEFGISRKTGYKIYQRYKEIGTKGLTDRSRQFSPCHFHPRAASADLYLSVRSRNSSCDLHTCDRCSAPSTLSTSSHPNSWQRSQHTASCSPFRTRKASPRSTG